MRRLLVAAVATGAVSGALLLAAAPASACTNPPQVGPWPTVDVCLGPDLDDLVVLEG